MSSLTEPILNAFDRITMKKRVLTLLDKPRWLKDEEKSGKAPKQQCIWAMIHFGNLAPCFTPEECAIYELLHMKVTS